MITNDTGSSGGDTGRYLVKDGEKDPADNANMMFVVVRNLKSQKPPEDQPQTTNSMLHDYRL